MTFKRRETTPHPCVNGTGGKKVKLCFVLSRGSNPISNKDNLSSITVSLNCPFAPASQACASKTHTPFPWHHRSSAQGPTVIHLVSDQAPARTCAERGLWIQAECHRSQESGRLLASGHSRSDLKKRIIHLYFAPQNNVDGFCPLGTLFPSDK